MKNLPHPSNIEKAFTHYPKRMARKIENANTFDTKKATARTMQNHRLGSIFVLDYSTGINQRETHLPMAVYLVRISIKIAIQRTRDKLGFFQLKNKLLITNLLCFPAII